MDETQIKAKIAKLKEQRGKLDDQIEDLELQLPQKVKTRGDPVVKFY